MAGEAYRFVFEGLRDRIVSGRYGSGERLPAERELCQEFGVSRITLRHAMRLLEERDLVSRQTGRGTFVKSPRSRKIPIVNSDFTKSLSDQSSVMTRKTTNRRIGIPNEEIRREMGLGEKDRCVLIERVDFRERIPVACDKVVIPVEFCGKVADVVFNRIDFFEAWTSIENLNVFQTCQTVEARKADEKMAKRLKIEPGEPVLWTRDVIYDESEKVVGLFDTAYRADVFRLVSTIMH